MNDTITNDLKIFTDVFPKLDRCITKYGSARLRIMLGTVMSDSSTLILRQNIIRQITLDYNKKNKLKKLLNRISQLYSFYTAFGTSSLHHKNCSNFMQEYNDMICTVKTVHKLYNHSNQLFKDDITNNFERLSKVFNDEVTLGYALTIKQQMENK